MKKRYFVLILFFVYVALLFILANQYEVRDQNSNTEGFSSSLGKGLSLYFRYLAISFLGSSIFLITAYAIHKKTFFLFMLLAPFLNVLVVMVVGLILNFILWITQLEKVVSTFYGVFIVATISTLGTTLWLIREVPRSKTERQGIHTT